ncbi:hypothetical protein [Tranquillimonas alkanivorans]|uniref:Uncharacterized protein n=1 Tax=Tranquillimonas alkanivorans TaxID=441119 RepID=A0A1I5W2F5_9RHOB|nr:hypothetical protein [Tranquillimonas alkanivorans]SFQ13767.1 hypothetical protein SAMN04488047_1395 [Tranquillimonas alkanivorans]
MSDKKENDAFSETVKQIARGNGYSDADIDGGMMFYARKNRLSNPPGEFDKAGRFDAAERTEAVKSVRAPSRAYPYPEMTAARTANHCAEVSGGVPLHVKRIAKARELVNRCEDAPDEVTREEIMRILKPVKEKIG